VPDLAGCSIPCETRHSLLVSELLLLESRPIRRPCRERLPTLDRRSFTQMPDLEGCSAPCETRHSLLLLVSELLLLLESRPIHRPCRERLPTLDRQSYKRVAHLVGCSIPCETRHSLLVSELLLLESRPNSRPCRERPPMLDWRSYKRVAHLAGCSAPCETRHSLLVSGSQLHTKCQICYIKLKYVSKDHCILEQRQVKTP
jgi:hypothetical protein